MTQPLELRDELGRVVACVLPIVASSNQDWEVPSLSPEERERRRQEPDYSTAEVLAHLQGL